MCRRRTYGYRLTEKTTLLHHAPTSENLTCSEWIIDNCRRLDSIRNHRRETLLDAFQAHLEVVRTQQKWRTKIVAVSNIFTGYSQPRVEMLCVLKGLSNLLLEELLRLKYGCTTQGVQRNAHKLGYRTRIRQLVQPLCRVSAGQHGAPLRAQNPRDGHGCEGGRESTMAKDYLGFGGTVEAMGSAS